MKKIEIKLTENKKISVYGLGLGIDTYFKDNFLCPSAFRSYFHLLIYVVSLHLINGSTRLRSPGRGEVCGAIFHPSTFSVLRITLFACS